MAKDKKDKKKVSDGKRPKVPIDSPDIEGGISSKGKISTDLSMALKDLSDLKLEEAKTNLDLARALRKTLITTLETIQGAFLAKPTQGNAYVIGTLVRHIQEMTETIEDSVDYEELIEELITDSIQPFLERALLDLGSIIQSSIERNSDTPKKRKAVKRILSDVYREFAAQLETKAPELEEKLNQHILELTS